MNRRRTLLSGVLTVALAGTALADVVTLSGMTTGSWRWKDVSGQAYATAYQAAYDYTQATVTIDYSGAGTALAGTLSAANLKPNFAYQLKLSGLSETDPAANEHIGLSGRWWQEEWLGAAWGNGANLNNKGSGASPNPNDLVYLARKDIPDAGSPTGLHYRYTGYRPFEYFITDATGAAVVPFVVDSVYHVLWKTSQLSPVAGDGPVLTHTFDPDPVLHPQYSTDYGATTTSVFGEWERLPTGGIALAPGAYNAVFELTEESFHGVDGALSGAWALAMSGPAQFSLGLAVPEPGTAIVALALLAGLCGERAFRPRS